MLQHVLPNGFRCARNFGFLHPNCKRLIALRCFGCGPPRGYDLRYSVAQVAFEPGTHQDITALMFGADARMLGNKPLLSCIPFGANPPSLADSGTPAAPSAA